MAKPNQYRAQDFIDVIPGTGGIITTIAKRVGCVWHTAKKYIDTYPTVAQAYADETESITDLAEVGLIKSLKAEDGPMIRFYLTTKGRHRGYVQKSEVDVRIEDLERAIEQELAEMAGRGTMATATIPKGSECPSGD